MKKGTNKNHKGRQVKREENGAKKQTQEKQQKGKEVREKRRETPEEKREKKSFRKNHRGISTGLLGIPWEGKECGNEEECPQNHGTEKGQN